MKKVEISKNNVNITDSRFYNDWFFHRKRTGFINAVTNRLLRYEKN